MCSDVQLMLHGGPHVFPNHFFLHRLLSFWFYLSDVTYSLPPFSAFTFTSSLPPPFSPPIILPGQRRSEGHSVSMANRTHIWHKSKQQQCGCCMATKSPTRLCSFCKMSHAVLLSFFFSHCPLLYCGASPSL